MAELPELVKQTGQPRKVFSYLTSGMSGTPWEVAFQSSQPLGYWQAFARRCSKVGKAGLVDEADAKKVWLSILKDYEDYKKLGMWIPEESLEEHRKVAEALGWI